MILFFALFQRSHSRHRGGLRIIFRIRTNWIEPREIHLIIIAKSDEYSGVRRGGLFQRTDVIRSARFRFRAFIAFAVASISPSRRASRWESRRTRKTAMVLFCIRDARRSHDTMDYPCRGETSHCHSPRRSRSYRCCRDVGPCPVRRYPDDEAPGAVTVHPHHHSSVRRASPEVAIVVVDRCADRIRASAMISMIRTQSCAV